jgi:hypothetical protein
VSVWVCFAQAFGICCEQISLPGGGTVNEKGTKQKNWLWPVGIVATGLAGAAVAILRGCWHQKMSWPIRVQEHSYQVCLGCGIKRLFDEHNFRSYGPYSYDLNRLIAWQRAQHIKYLRESEDKVERPAS